MRQTKCKHQFAVEFTIHREATRVEETVSVNGHRVTFGPGGPAAYVLKTTGSHVQADLFFARLANKSETK